MTTAYPLPGAFPTQSSESIPASSRVEDTPVTEEKLREETQPGQASKPITSRDQSSIGAPAVQTAKQNMPGQGIKDNVSSPVSSGERREEPHVSLPSTELKGARPLEHTGGVGALPGNLSESSVALLPDERQERAEERRPASPRQRRDTIKPSITGEDDKRQPREFDEEAAKPTGDAAESVGSTTVPGYGAEGGREDGSQEEGATTAKKVKAGYGGDYHPAQLHPPPPGASVADHKSLHDAEQERQESPTTETGKQASMGAEKKPGFMTMVKGEMKILAGKVSRDEHKVEEGKKIVHGGA